MGRVTLRDISRHETTDTKAALVQFDAGAKIERLYVENVAQTTAPGVDAPMWKNEADIKELIMK